MIVFEHGCHILVSTTTPFIAVSSVTPTDSEYRRSITVASCHDRGAQRDIARGVAATSHAALVRGDERVRGPRFRRVPCLVGVERGPRPPREAARGAARATGSLVASRIPAPPGSGRRGRACLEGSRHTR